jgi:hypothetical protein
MIGAAATEQEEVGWDEDSEEESSEEEESDDEEASSDDDEASVKPKETKDTKDPKDTPRPASAGSSTTIHPATQEPATNLKPEEARKSHDEKSQADSDGSYDVVGAASGVASRAPNSPKEAKKDEEEDESSEEEDWE